MLTVIESWLQEQGFKQEENGNYVLVKNDITFGFDLDKNFCWIDGEDIYAMKHIRRTNNISEVEDIYFVCGFDLNFNPIDNLKYFKETSIGKTWLKTQGFVVKDDKWCLTINGNKVIYNFDTKELSIISRDKKEGFEGKINNEELIEKIIYYVFD